MEKVRDASLIIPFLSSYLFVQLEEMHLLNIQGHFCRVTFCCLKELNLDITSELSTSAFQHVIPALGTGTGHLIVCNWVILYWLSCSEMVH